MNARISITVNGDTFERDYFVCETRAPKAYDYAGVIHIEEGGDTRILAIPQGDYMMQSGRYASGMYACRKLPVPQDDPLCVDPSYIMDAILAKLQ
jgi:hypothetical protein